MSRKNTREERRRRKRNIRLVIVTLIIYFIIVTIANVIIYQRDHFKSNTIINGINCSNLTVEEAQNEIKNEILLNNIVKFIFSKGDKYSVYTVSLSKFEPVLCDELDVKLAEVLQQQPLFPKRDFQDFINFENFISVNQAKVKEVLLEFSEITQSSEEIPNASIIYDENLTKYKVNIDSSQIRINIDAALEVAVSSLQKGIIAIDFYDLANQKLLEETQRVEKRLKPINDALATTIVYYANGAEILIVDANVIKEWVYKDENENYSINLDEQFNNLIMQLQEKIKSLEFEATDIGKISVNFQKKAMPQIDKEQEIDWLKQNFGDGQYHERNVSYVSGTTQIDSDSYIELDITRQKIWMYIQGKCILESSCVTGNVAGGHGTPTGIYYLTSKTTNAVLRGYNSDGSRYASPVTYWMPFNGGIGFHDASWRKGVFGGEIYKTNGSHGCVNMPFEAAKTLYENISSDIPIIIYKS